MAGSVTKINFQRGSRRNNQQLLWSIGRPFFLTTHTVASSSQLPQLRQLISESRLHVGKSRCITFGRNPVNRRNPRGICNVCWWIKCPLHRPYGQRPHICQRPKIAIHRPCFWSLEPIPATKRKSRMRKRN